GSGQRSGNGTRALSEPLPDQDGVLWVGDVEVGAVVEVDPDPAGVVEVRAGVPEAQEGGDPLSAVPEEDADGSGSGVTVFLPELPGALRRVARHPSELLDGLGVRLEWLPGGEARGQDCPAVSARSSGRVALAVLTTPDKTESTAVDVRDGDAVGRRFLAQGREP